MSFQKVVQGQAAREGIRRGVEALANAVKVTLGPRGRTVVIESETGQALIVNSGVVVARAIELADPLENMGVQMLREVAMRTSTMAGDGTTTATVLAQRMIHEGLKNLTAGMNPVGLKSGIDRAIQSVVDELARLAQPCVTPLEMAHIACVSANDDESIGYVVARAMGKVGLDGSITLESSPGIAHDLSFVEGLRFAQGYLSPYFVNEPERGMVVLENPRVLLCDCRLSSVVELVPLLDALAECSSPLLVIAEEFDSEVLAALVVNHARGSVTTCAVKAPGFADQRHAFLQDIATVTGAKLVSDQLGLALPKVTLKDLGRVKRVEVDSGQTTLVGGAGTPASVRARANVIRKERDVAKTDSRRQPLEERLARLCSAVAVIKLGASTETELNERKLRAQDAVHAVRAAAEEGIVPGGGVALLRCSRVLGSLGIMATLDENAGIAIVRQALEEPLRQIVRNAGEDPSVVLDRVQRSVQRNFGYNAATCEYGDLVAMGVIDPVKVTRLALQNAGSIAGLVLTLDCLLTNELPT